MSRGRLLCRHSVAVARTWPGREQVQAEERQHQEETDPILAQVAVWREALHGAGRILLVGDILIAYEMI